MTGPTRTNRTNRTAVFIGGPESGRRLEIEDAPMLTIRFAQRGSSVFEDWSSSQPIPPAVPLQYTTYKQMVFVDNTGAQPLIYATEEVAKHGVLQYLLDAYNGGEDLLK